MSCDGVSPYCEGTCTSALLRDRLTSTRLIAVAGDHTNKKILGCLKLNFEDIYKNELKFLVVQVYG
jgi:hypothetical protein